MDLESLMLVEEFVDLPRPVDGLQGVALQPIDSGFALTWTEVSTAGERSPRTGMVLALGPRQRSVWVQPDDRRPGEGDYVLVDEVTEESAATAQRRVGVDSDYLSTEAWQRPSQLPCAYVRRDRHVGGGFVVRLLHADRTCPGPGSPFGPVVTGRARKVPACRVFVRWLHPSSVRPVDPDRRDAGNPYVRFCGVCLRPGRPYTTGSR